MSPDVERWTGTSRERALVRDELMRELVFRVMLHDLRGSLTAVRGWVELLGMDGARVPGGLVRSVDAFSAVVERYAGLAWPGGPREGQPSLKILVSQGLGLEFSGLEGPGPVDALRLCAALDLAAPARVELLEETLHSVCVAVVKVHGLPDEGVALCLTPHHEELLRRMRAPDRVLGTCLLREVARCGRGQVRSRLPGTLDIVCRVN